MEVTPLLMQPSSRLADEGSRVAGGGLRPVGPGGPVARSTFLPLALDGATSLCCSSLVIFWGIFLPDASRILLGWFFFRAEQFMD